MSENKPLPGHIGFGFGTPVRVSKFLPEDCIYVASEGTLKKALLTMNTVAEQEIEIAALRAERDALKGEVERLRGLCEWGTAEPVGPKYDRLLAAEAALGATRAEFDAYRNEREPKYRVRTEQAEAALESLRGEVRGLRAWQEAVAEGLGFLNRAEGQSGYEVAEPSVILAALLKRVGE